MEFANIRNRCCNPRQCGDYSGMNIVARETSKASPRNCSILNLFRGQRAWGTIRGFILRSLTYEWSLVAILWRSRIELAGSMRSRDEVNAEGMISFLFQVA